MCLCYKNKKIMHANDIDRIIEMAWEDRTPFEAIRFQYGINEDVILKIMRKHLKYSSFKLWRKRINKRITKHLKKRGFTRGKHKSYLQKEISLNKISKRRNYFS